MEVKATIELVNGNGAASDRWRLFCSHGTILFYIVRHPGCTVREISDALALTPRTVWGLIGDLRRAGLITVRREGRRHHYCLDPGGTFPDPILSHLSLAEAMRAIEGGAPLISKRRADDETKVEDSEQKRRLNVFRRVLVTLDGSKLSEAALPEAAKLARGTGAEVHLLTVAEEPRATTMRPESEPLTVGVPAPGAVVRIKASPTAETKAQAMGRITDELREFLIAEAVPFDRVGIRYHTAVRFGDPAEGIVRYAEEENVDLIIMATHGHTGLGRLVFGSVASKIVASGVCPVLLVRPDGLKEE